MRVQTEHTYYGIDQAGFAKMYYSEPYNNAVAPIVSLAERRIDSIERLSDGKVRRKIYMRPHVKLPAVIQKLIQGAELSYYEISVYDPSSFEARYHIESGAGDLLAIQGTISFLPVEGGVCRRIEGQVDVSIFGIGTVVERFITAEVKRRYDAVHTFTQKFILDSQDAQRGP